jgi:SagB-type dehydrogenase family enzyme
MSFLCILVMLLTQGSDMIILPEPEYSHKSLEQCIESRRSLRSFQDKQLTLSDISLLTWAAQGITAARGFRVAPSAGATYPLEIFLAQQDGLFRYLPQSHGLKREKGGDLRKDIARAALNQGFIGDAGTVFIIAAVFERTTQRYGERGVRYVHNEVGHCAQNIHLQATALGLGSVPVGAFDDVVLKEILELSEEEPLYIVPVGYVK